MRIEEAAVKKQARIDSGTDIIVGVNAFKNCEKAELDILEVEGDEVRKQQIVGLEKLKKGRDKALVTSALIALEEAAQGKENLLSLAIEAAKARATLGEISLALEKKWGRYKATTKTISGVYSGR